MRFKNTDKGDRGSCRDMENVMELTKMVESGEGVEEELM